VVSVANGHSSTSLKQVQTTARIYSQTKLQAHACSWNGGCGNGGCGGEGRGEGAGEGGGRRGAEGH
jgi:hypothetical protein